MLYSVKHNLGSERLICRYHLYHRHGSYMLKYLADVSIKHNRRQGTVIRDHYKMFDMFILGTNSAESNMYNK